MNMQALIQNLKDQIKEAQLKQGYVKETIHFYYPPKTLDALIEEPALEEEELVKKLQEHANGSELGHLQFALRKEEGQGRIEVNVPPEGAEYVNRAVKTNPFLADMIALFGNNHACSLEQIRSVFEQYSTEYVCQKMPESADFDYVLYFEDPQIDAYYYCVKKEMEHTIYHRFTQKDYEALLD